MSTTGIETSLNDTDFAKIRSIVHENTGITIAENRRSMLFSRLQRRLRETGEKTFRDYISRVSSDPVEMQELTNRVTTNETYFYRTPRVWAYLEEDVIPAFLEGRSNRPFKAWSAASSTGEEGHTIGVVLENIRKNNAGFDYSVTGTDISSRVVEIAEKGLYKGRAINRFRKEKPELFSNYMFGNDENGFAVKPDIKRRLNFKLHNLLRKLPSGGPFDVVFLRNVLIYFTNEDQEKILAHVHGQLRPEGTLIIGESESLRSLNCKFEPVGPLIYRPSMTLQKAQV